MCAAPAATRRVWRAIRAIARRSTSSAHPHAHGHLNRVRRRSGSLAVLGSSRRGRVRLRCENARSRVIFSAECYRAARARARNTGTRQGASTGRSSVSSSCSSEDESRDALTGNRAPDRRRPRRQRQRAREHQTTGSTAQHRSQMTAHRVRTASLSPKLLLTSGQALGARRQHQQRHGAPGRDRRAAPLVHVFLETQVLS